MKGTMLVFRPTGALGEPPSAAALIEPPDVSRMQEIVGGYIEAVPGFYSVEIGGKVERCAAFCNEDGKRDPLPINRRATLLWDAALKRNDPPATLRAGDQYLDVLVGSVIVITGDDEFMEAL